MLLVHVTYKMYHEDALVNLFTFLISVTSQDTTKKVLNPFIFQNSDCQAVPIKL